MSNLRDRVLHVSLRRETGNEEQEVSNVQEV
jgi:hypothetical protein